MLNILRCSSALALFAALGGGASAAQPNMPPAVPKNIASAWSDAGLSRTWLRISPTGTVEAVGFSAAKADDLPAFSMYPWRDGKLAGLPDPGVPFGLQLQGPNPYMRDRMQVSDRVMSGADLLALSDPGSV